MNQQMNCNEFELRIHELLDQRLDLHRDGQLAEHALRCVECDRLLSEYQQFCIGVEFLPRADAAAGRNYKSLPAAHTATRRSAASRSTLANDSRDISRSRYPWVAVMGFAATVLLCIWIGIAWRSLLKPGAQIAEQPGAAIDANAYITDDAGYQIDPHAARQEAHPLNLAIFEKFSGSRLHIWSFDGDFVAGAVPDLTAITEQNLVTNLRWDGIGEQFRPLDTYYQVSSELPGVRPLRHSVNWTMGLIQKSIQKQPNSDARPDLGRSPDTLNSSVSA